MLLPGLVDLIILVGPVPLSHQPGQRPAHPYWVSRERVQEAHDLLLACLFPHPPYPYTADALWRIQPSGIGAGRKRPASYQSRVLADLLAERWGWFQPTRRTVSKVSVRAMRMLVAGDHRGFMIRATRRLPTGRPRFRRPGRRPGPRPAGPGRIAAPRPAGLRRVRPGRPPGYQFPACAGLAWPARRRSPRAGAGGQPAPGAGGRPPGTPHRSRAPWSPPIAGPPASHGGP